jgi:hypothetical protein
MKRHPLYLIFHLAFLAMCTLLLTACPGGGDYKQDYSGNPDNAIETYPVTFSGVASVAYPWDIGTEVKMCSTEGTFELLTQPDMVCYLTVIAEGYYTDPVTTDCTASGDNMGYSVKGKFNRREQLCQFSTCIDEQYSAEGALPFYATGVGEGNARCYYKAGDLMVSIHIASGKLKK